jgi:RNA polymerase sigma-70 factor (ECF subfamily)
MTLPPTSPDLLRAAADGDLVAWDRLLKDWLPIVLGWCRRLGGPDMDAEDLAHDACMKMLYRLDQLRAPEAFPSWLYQITRDTLRKRRERQQRWAIVRSLLPLPSPVAPPARDPAAGDLVLRLLQELPEAQREVLVLCLVEERTRQEAAELLDIPIGTLKSRLRLGTDRLRTLAQAAGLAPSDEEAAS